MGYRIYYTNGGCKTMVCDKPKRPTTRWRVFVLLVFAIIAIVLICQNDNLRYWFLPGDGAVTETAFKNFIQTIQDGTEIRDAVTAFCREVIESAG